MSRQSPWDCPFCGRMSATEPQEKRGPQTHTVERPAAGVYAVRCWFCGARGLLSGARREAIQRWQHSAEMKGAPRW